MILLKYSLTLRETNHAMYFSFIVNCLSKRSVLFYTADNLNRFACGEKLESRDTRIKNHRPLSVFMTLHNAHQVTLRRYIGTRVTTNEQNSCRVSTLLVLSLREISRDSYAVGRIGMLPEA